MGGQPGLPTSNFYHRWKFFLRVLFPILQTEKVALRWFQNNLNILKSLFCQILVLGNMAAMPWSCHDQTMITVKCGYDHAMMTAMFLDIVVMINGMITIFSMILYLIMVWSACFQWFFFSKKHGLFINVFSNSFHTPSYGTLYWPFWNQTAALANLNEDYSWNRGSFCDN